MAGIKESFSKGFTTLNVKTNNFVEETKIKTYIGTLENEISELKRIVGGTLFDMWKAEKIEVEKLEPPLREMQSKLDEIEKQKQRIKEMHEEADQILGKKDESVSNGRVFCTGCGAPNSSSNKFCIKCGQPMQ